MSSPLFFYEICAISLRRSVAAQAPAPRINAGYLWDHLAATGLVAITVLLIALFKIRRRTGPTGVITGHLVSFHAGFQFDARYLIAMLTVFHGGLDVIFALGSVLLTLHNTDLSLLCCRGFQHVFCLIHGATGTQQGSQH